MRPIEYRAWYHKEQKMFEVTNLRWRYPIVYEDLELESFELIDRDSKNCHRVHIQDRNVELMQYTGLQDKNGKKIFEGDIVTWREPEMINKCVGQVVYGKQNGAFCFYLPRVGTGIRVPMLNFIRNTMSLVANNDFEVIGNVWEHPTVMDSTEQNDSTP